MGAHHRFQLVPTRHHTIRARFDRLWLHTRRSLAIVGCGAALVGIGYLALVWGPTLLVDEKGLSAEALTKAENDVRSTLIQALAGLALIVGLYFTARSYAASKTSQITERFSRSIAQLGDPEVNVRIGAVYALEGIGLDSNQTYHTVVDILMRFIREQSPTTAGHPPHEPRETEVTGDVKVAIELLGRRRHHRHESERLQFRELVLPGANFQGNYDAADFCYADLDGCSLTRSRFVDAHFGWASLHGAFLSRSDFEDSSFCAAHLEGAFLVGANLKDADFEDANLSGAVLSGPPRVGPAMVDGADFTNASLSGTLLNGVDLRKAKGLTSKQIEEAVTDDQTILPVDLA